MTMATNDHDTDPLIQHDTLDIAAITKASTRVYWFKVVMCLAYFVSMWATAVAVTDAGNLTFFDTGFVGPGLAVAGPLVYLVIVVMFLGDLEDNPLGLYLNEDGLAKSRERAKTQPGVTQREAKAQATKSFSAAKGAAIVIGFQMWLAVGLSAMVDGQVTIPWWLAVLFTVALIALTRSVKNVCVTVAYASRVLLAKATYDTLADDEKFPVDVSGGISVVKRVDNTVIFRVFRGITMALICASTAAVVASGWPIGTALNLTTFMLLGLMILSGAALLVYFWAETVDLYLYTDPDHYLSGSLEVHPGWVRPGGTEWWVAIFPATFVVLSWCAVFVSWLGLNESFDFQLPFALAMTVVGLVLIPIGAKSAGRLRTATFLYNPLSFHQDLFVDVKLPPGAKLPERR
jgi:hypothetical protein